MVKVASQEVVETKPCNSDQITDKVEVINPEEMVDESKTNSIEEVYVHEYESPSQAVLPDTSKVNEDCKELDEQPEIERCFTGHICCGFWDYEAIKKSMKDEKS